MCIILQDFIFHFSGVGDICGADGKWFTIHVDGQPTKQTERVLAFIKFSYQEPTWNCIHRSLMRLAWEGERKESYRRKKIATPKEWEKPGSMPPGISGHSF